MKNLFLSGTTLLLSIVFTPATAQHVLVGVKAGVNYTGVTSPNYLGPQRRWAPAAGVFAQLPLSSDGFLLLQPELLYSAKGSKSQYSNGTYTNRLHYIDLPVLARVNAGGLFFELGPQVSFLVAASYQTPVGNDTNLRGSNRLVAGGVAGVGYQLPMGLGLGVRYTHDLTRLSPQGPRNTVFQLQASYLFGGK